MIEHEALVVTQARAHDGSASFAIRCEDCGWTISIIGLLGSAKDCGILGGGQRRDGDGIKFCGFGGCTRVIMHHGQHVNVGRPVTVNQ